MFQAGVPMCLDPNAMEWAHAWQSHGPATDKTGFIYMLAGDTGASNTDPYATAKTDDNHWIETGSHVMVVGAAARTMAGYQTTADPDPTKPYVMWPGSPYEHLIIPVKWGTGSSPIASTRSSVTPARSCVVQQATQADVRRHRGGCRSDPRRL
jgi:hypothetical protein